MKSRTQLLKINRESRYYKTKNIPSLHFSFQNLFVHSNTDVVNHVLEAEKKHEAEGEGKSTSDRKRLEVLSTEYSKERERETFATRHTDSKIVKERRCVKHK